MRTTADWHLGVRIAAIGAFTIASLSGCPGNLPVPAEQYGAVACTDPTVLFRSRCALGGCHNASDQAGGMDLVSPDVGQRLLDQPAIGAAGYLIDGHSPEDSVLLAKLSASPPFGSRMPLVGEPLKDTTMACLLDWSRRFANSNPVDAGTSSPDLMQVTTTYTLTADTAFDPATQLMWQRLTPPSARGFDGYCADLVLGGHDDWRMPTLVELTSLLVPDKAACPLIDEEAFPGTICGWYMSATNNAGQFDNWMVNFLSGHKASVLQVANFTSYFGRCVRGP